MPKKIIIASRNPVKINATRLAFGKMFPDEEFILEGISVPSEVPDQPLSCEETRRGALNRSNNAKAHTKDADYWVGIEGGIEKLDDGMMTFAWIILQSEELVGKSRTSAFFLPRAVIELIDSGMELGHANDVVFKRDNSKQKGGTVGILTNELATRTSYYTEAMILALIPFKNREIY